MATSLETGVTISVHSETEAVSSNQECRDTFWKKSAGSPSVKTNIQFSSIESALLVTHLGEAEFRGKVEKSANGHAYFAKNGLCIDLHVSHWPYQPGSEMKVDAILRSITIVE